MNSFWEQIKRRLAGERRPIVGAAAGQGRKDSAPLSLPVLGGLGGIPPGPNIPPYSPRLPPQPPHEPPIGRPGWWSAALPQSRLLYPDDQFNVLLEEMRRTVPILDRAIAVLTGLCGRVELSASKSVLAELNPWLATIKVNQTGRGLQTWLEAHVDAMLLYGKGVTEVVPGRRGGHDGMPYDVYALMNLDPRSIVFQVTPDPLVLLPLQRQHVNAFLVSLNPETLLVSVNGGHSDNPHGWSLYRSLPFVAQSARAIENATAQAWQRMGCPSYHINWDPPPTFADPSGALAAGTLATLQAQWNQTMAGRAVAAGGTGGNTIADYFTAGNVKVEVIGHDHTPLPLADTWRVFEEQLVAATGLPSWLLGFHWSTTERMASQQSEILLAQIEGLRRHVQPAVERLIDLRQRLAGKSGRVKVGWSQITLHDVTEQARGRAWEQQARQRQIANATTMWQLGFWNQQQALLEIDPDAAAPAVPYAAPPVAPSPGGNMVTPSEGYSG